jgi:hypothetical protein
MYETFVITALQKMLDYLQRDRKTQDLQKDEALKALLNAITKTLTHLDSRGDGVAFRDAEIELSRLWNEAAIQMRHVSKGLAIRLSDKADYWAARIEWSPEEIAAKQIRLAEIRDEFRKLVES